MGGDRGVEGGRGPGPPPGKSGTSFPREASPHLLLELSGSAHACLTVEFFFLSSFFACNRCLAIILSSADVQADLRLCCLHATKLSFSQQGTYGMG